LFKIDFSEKQSDGAGNENKKQLTKAPDPTTRGLSAKDNLKQQSESVTNPLSVPAEGNRHDATTPHPPAQLHYTVKDPQATENSKTFVEVEYACTYTDFMNLMAADTAQAVSFRAEFVKGFNQACDKLGTHGISIEFRPVDQNTQATTSVKYRIFEKHGMLEDAQEKTFADYANHNRHQQIHRNDPEVKANPDVMARSFNSESGTVLVAPVMHDSIWQEMHGGVLDRNVYRSFGPFFHNNNLTKYPEIAKYHHQVLQLMAAKYKEKIAANQPVYICTDGAFAWLHIRLETRDKNTYYYKSLDWKKVQLP
jgi:hypothetical protein